MGLEKEPYICIQYCIGMLYFCHKNALYCQLVLCLRIRRNSKKFNCKKILTNILESVCKNGLIFFNALSIEILMKNTHLGKYKFIVIQYSIKMHSPSQCMTSSKMDMMELWTTTVQATYFIIWNPISRLIIFW